MSAPKTKFLVLSSVNNNVIHLETISILTTAANAVLGLFLARLAVASSLQPKKRNRLEHSARSNVSGTFWNILENTCFPVNSRNNR